MAGGGQQGQRKTQAVSAVVAEAAGCLLLSLNTYLNIANENKSL